ncbi:putative leader peptide [Rhodococcus sp. B10]
MHAGYTNSWGRIHVDLCRLAGATCRS